MVSSTRRFLSRPTRHGYIAFEFLDRVSIWSLRGIRRALYEIGGEAQRDIVHRLTTGRRTGRFYAYRGRIIQASAPGEHPARRSGKLARSVDYRVRGWYELEVGIRGNFPFNYPAALEFGTIKMERRPYIEPASNRFGQEMALRLAEFAPVELRRGPVR